MKVSQNNYQLLRNQRQLGKHPMQHVRHVLQTTTQITEAWQRIDQREVAFYKAETGQYGAAVEAASKRHIAGREVLSASLANIAHGLSDLAANEASADIAPIPREPALLSRHVKRLGYFLGADIVGICKLPGSAVYKCDMQGKPVEINYKFAIVILSEKDYLTGCASEGWDWIADPMSLQAYQKSAMVAVTLADYLRRLGFPSLAQYGPFNYTVQIPPLVLLAGLGEVSRVGIILNPFLGLNFKASAVLTDLPLLPDKAIDFGLQDFCGHCGICADKCPSQAISHDSKVIYNGYETWKLNTQRCASFVLTNKHGSWCNTCVKVCPWMRPHTWQHNVVRGVVSRSAVARRIAIKFDQAFGKKTGNDKEKWWFDLPVENGRIVSPSIDTNEDNQKA